MQSSDQINEKGRDGQKAHFEHFRRNSKCSESVAFGQHEEYGDNKHTYIKENQEDIEASYSNQELLGFVLNPSVIQPVLCESIEELYKRAKEIETDGYLPVGQKRPVEISRTTTIFRRDAAVVSFVLSRANGICEACGVKAPFTTSSGNPYLEVHHVNHLANGGSDTINNTISVCPNCHKELHFGVNSSELKEEVYKRVSQLARN